MTHTSRREKSAPVTKDMAGNTPLINAVIYRDIETVRSIAALGGTALNAQGWAGNTALHMAVLLGNEAALQVLLAAAKINTRVLNDSDLDALTLAKQERPGSLIEQMLNQAVAGGQNSYATPQSPTRTRGAGAVTACSDLKP